MTSVNITVVEQNPSDAKERYRWAVTRNGREVESGVAADEESAYQAAKPHFDILRAEMALLAAEHATEKAD